MQRQMSEPVDKFLKLEAKVNLVEEVNVQLYSTVMSQAEQIKCLKSQIDRRTEECYSTKESLSDSINILSAEIQDLRRFAASHSACHAIGYSNGVVSPNGPSFQPSFDVRNEEDDDDTGLIFQTTFQEFMNELTFQGDLSLKNIQKRLVRLTLSKEVLQSWNPRDRSKVVKRSKKEVIRKILSKQHIHKFKNHQSAYTTAKTSSVWHAIVKELYPRKSAAERKKLVQYFSKASKSRPGRPSTFFSTFIDTVIQLHRDHCERCPSQLS